MISPTFVKRKKEKEKNPHGASHQQRGRGREEEDHKQVPWCSNQPSAPNALAEDTPQSSPSWEAR